MFSPRWYTCNWPDDEPVGVYQVDSVSSYALPEHILRLAHREYESQYGNRQDYERMQERGGLSLLEVVRLLADYVERLGGIPTAPR
jgi:hypothetical protein